MPRAQTMNALPTPSLSGTSSMADILTSHSVSRPARIPIPNAMTYW